MAIFSNICKTFSWKWPLPSYSKGLDFVVFGEISKRTILTKKFTKNLKKLRNIWKNGPFFQKIPPPKKKHDHILKSTFFHAISSFPMVLDLQEPHLGYFLECHFTGDSPHSDTQSGIYGNFWLGSKIGSALTSIWFFLCARLRRRPESYISTYMGHV